MVARLERQGWIVSYEGEEGWRRYQITDLGRLALQAHERSYQKYSERCPDGQRGKERIMPLVFWILRLYPPGWRERYEAEMAALLEEHHISWWTILDLLLGALDARLDPHYRQERQFLPLRRFKSSWRLLVASFVVFWFALLPWFWMSQIGLDDADCSGYAWQGNTAPCVLRKTLGAPQYSNSGSLLALILIFLPILLMIFMAMLVMARGKKANTHLVLAQVVTVGMIVLCIVCGFWLAGFWHLLPQIGQFYPQTPAGLLVGIVAMGLASVLAQGSLARAAFALRAMEKAAPKQEGPIAGAGGLSSSTSDQQQDDYHLEARSAEESEGQQQEMPMVLRASAPVREEPATSLARGGTSKAAKGEWALLVGLVLLFIVPWPALISGGPSDQPTLLFDWLLAVVVGLITTWLVKEPGKKWEQRASRKPRRAASPLWWAAVLAAPGLTFFIFYIGHGPEGFLLLLPAGIVSGATALIVKIRMGHPRIKRPLVVSLGVMVLATIFMALGVSHTGFFPQQSTMFVVNLMSIASAFLVRVPGRKQQVEGASRQQDTGAGAAPKVVGWAVLILACNAVYAQVSSALYLNQGHYNAYAHLPPWLIPPWIGGNEMLLSIVMLICLIPALVVKIQTSNRWAAGMSEPAPRALSPRVWIVALPVVFLTFVTQIQNVFGPNSITFANVFSIWLLTGEAALIMLLAIRLGSRKRMKLPEREVPQTQAQG